MVDIPWQEIKPGFLSKTSTEIFCSAGLPCGNPYSVKNNFKEGNAKAARYVLIINRPSNIYKTVCTVHGTVA